MTSNQRERDKTKNAAAEAAQKAKEATMASIVQLVDDEAAKSNPDCTRKPPATTVTGTTHNTPA
jgi:hypothetical protein